MNEETNKQTNKQWNIYMVRCLLTRLAFQMLAGQTQSWFYPYPTIQYSTLPSKHFLPYVESQSGEGLIFSAGWGNIFSKDVSSKLCSCFFPFHLAPSFPFLAMIAQISAQLSMPWQVLIATCENQSCGGSILNRYWVLTTAQCVREA